MIVAGCIAAIVWAALLGAPAASPGAAAPLGGPAASPGPAAPLGEPVAPAASSGAEDDRFGGLSSSRRTLWRPGIPGGIPAIEKIHATIDAAKYGNGIRDATDEINEAIQSAGDAAERTEKPQVVYLPAGIYRTTGIIELNRSHVVLRGAGPTRTRIRLDSANDGQPVIRFGIFWPSYQEKAWPVVGDVPKGATTITLANRDAKGIQAGDILQIDQEDPGFVWLFDGRHRKRQPEADVNGPGTGAKAFESVEKPGGPWRSIGQQIEIASKEVGPERTVLHLAGPIHIAFEAARRPEVFHTATARPGFPGTTRSGIENLYIAGGTENNIATVNLSHSWIANIESDGDPRTKLPGKFLHAGGMTGQHINLLHAYRCVVRDSYFHHARSINQGGGAYGISIANGSSDNLIENNIVVHLNKPIVMNRSGGGNVIAYNYADNAYSVGFPGWQETAIDGNHTAFSHHDLFEGNWAANIGSDTTHGNSGWHTFFRNYVPGRNSAPPVQDEQNVRAVGVDGWSREHNFVGNVLLEPKLAVRGYEPVYECAAKGLCMRAAAAFRIGGSVGEYDRFDDGTALRLLLRHGNWDGATGKVQWDPGIASRKLPPSLYLEEKPGFFGKNPWPWVDPLGATKVHTLPAKQRYDAMR